jgi:hypothetical protein
MRIKRVPSTNIRRDHEELMALLELCEAAGLGEHMRVGVRNQYGDICLSIETDNPQEYMNVISCLDGRDMRDELAEAEGAVGGFNAIFTDIQRR